MRETNDEAWKAADDLIRYLDDDTIAKAQSIFARMDSVGQQRMAALHGGRRDKLEISPNLWAGVGLVRGGAGTALVGDPQTVAARIKEYAALGIDTFILSGYPHLEEAYRFAELVFPLLAAQQQRRHRSSRRSIPARSARPSPTMRGRISVSAQSWRSHDPSHHERAHRDDDAHAAPHEACELSPSGGSAASRNGSCRS